MQGDRLDYFPRRRAESRTVMVAGPPPGARRSASTRTARVATRGAFEADVPVGECRASTSRGRLLSPHRLLELGRRAGRLPRDGAGRRRPRLGADASAGSRARTSTSASRCGTRTAGGRPRRVPQRRCARAADVRLGFRGSQALRGPPAPRTLREGVWTTWDESGVVASRERYEHDRDVGPGAGAAFPELAARRAAAYSLRSDSVRAARSPALAEREVLDVDVLFVAAVPPACRRALASAAVARAARRRSRRRPAASAGRGHGRGRFEKAETIGAHTISGAVVDPRALDELLPRLARALAAAGAGRLRRAPVVHAARAISLPHPPLDAQHRPVDRLAELAGALAGGAGRGRRREPVSPASRPRI